MLGWYIRLRKIVFAMLCFTAFIVLKDQLNGRFAVIEQKALIIVTAVIFISGVVDFVNMKIVERPGGVAGRLLILAISITLIYLGDTVFIGWFFLLLSILSLIDLYIIRSFSGRSL